MKDSYATLSNEPGVLPDVCGERTYVITTEFPFIKLVSPTNPWTTDFQIEVETTDITVVGTYIINMTASLATYTNVNPQSATFKVIIKKSD